jgi:type II secretory pathway pseudopilin PulG
MTLKNNNSLATSFKEVARGNKGISLVALIITIIVIVILAAIALNTFFTTTETQALKTKALNEFIEIENAVFQRGQENKLDSSVYTLIGTELSNSSAMFVNNKNYGDGYYLVNKYELFGLGVNSTTHDYIVNYSNGEVTLVTPYVIDGKNIYTKDDLIFSEVGDSVVDMATYNEEKGVNAPIVFTGMLPVVQENGKWKIVSKDDDSWYDYTITEHGPNRTANVMLLDGVTAKDSNGRYYTNEELRGMNPLDREGLYIENEGSMFVWFPRYTYKIESNGTKSIVYSKLTNDYTLNGYTKSPSFYFGEYSGATPDNDNAGYVAGGKELSGIWISKYEAKYVY